MQLHLETFQEDELSSNKKEEDFFADCENIDNNEFNNNENNRNVGKISTEKVCVIKFECNIPSRKKITIYENLTICKQLVAESNYTLLF